MLLNCRWRDWRHNLLLKSSNQQNYKVFRGLRFKMLSKKLQNDNEKLKGSIARLKLQDEEL